MCVIFLLYLDQKHFVLARLQIVQCSFRVQCIGRLYNLKDAASKWDNNKWLAPNEREKRRERKNTHLLHQFIFPSQCRHPMRSPFRMCCISLLNEFEERFRFCGVLSLPPPQPLHDRRCQFLFLFIILSYFMFSLVVIVQHCKRVHTYKPNAHRFTHRKLRIQQPKSKQ